MVLSVAINLRRVKIRSHLAYPGHTRFGVHFGIAITQLRLGESVVQIQLVVIRAPGQGCIHNAINIRQKTYNSRKI